MLGGRTILIVDDEEVIVELLTLLLDGDGRTILGAYDGVEALGIIREHRPNLVISNVMMPRLDGRELCRTIRADPELADTRVVLMSAGHKLDVHGYGEDLFIRKPFDLVEVEQTVKRLLSELS